MDGIANIWKPKGITSHDVVARIRRAAGTRRVGHTGTLDPMAEGVLPVCIGKATHAVDYIVATRKTYRATLCLGAETDTEDSTGTILREYPIDVGEKEIPAVLASFVGEKEQIPPMYSAVHIGGQRLYTLARQGITVERKPRRVTFYEIEPEKIAPPYVTFSVTCSKGAYIRTLCADIGKALSTGAYMTALARTASGSFTAENAVELEKFCTAPADYILPIDTVFSDYIPVTLSEEEEKRILCGAPIKNPTGQNGKFRLYKKDGTLLCISQSTDNRILKMMTSFY